MGPGIKNLFELLRAASPWRRGDASRPKTWVEITDRGIVVRWHEGKRQLPASGPHGRYLIRCDCQRLWIHEAKSDVTRLLSWPVGPETTLVSGPSADRLLPDED